ncbi:MAG: hypothetical protein ACXAC7_03460 [Candidatus Hodarchaeales archaeon]|jgi:predicted RNA binding protein with dsRBD fold (UPF0201 family)
MNQTINRRFNIPSIWKYNKIKIQINTEIKFSENPILVKKALKNLFPNLELQTNDEKTRITGNSQNPEILYHFFERIYELQILDAARRCVLEGIHKPSSDEEIPIITEFFLHKQVALLNKISFVDPMDAPLGPISIKIICNDLKQFIDQFFPKFEWFKQFK